MTDTPADALAARLAPYRVHPGIVAALLISRDGFIVAADADADVAVDAVAAQAAGVIDISSRLATELGQHEAKYISVELDALNVVLAPFGDELMLALVGRPDTLTCDYRLADGGG
jgi:predicted regulator of Ras-like GTPase activity (Roadblock/LC7/MglB family)